jgi:cyclohexa-1,5-dienecarbonyl-CoA hydratase
MSLDVSFNADHTRAALVFSHPKGNLITAELVTQLRQAVGDLAEARHLKLVTIEGAGADFSFGASVPEHAPDVIVRVLPDFHALIGDLVHLPIPTAAVVRGRCFGGGFELALACDFVLAADTASFALPEIALGVFPPAASVLLPRRVGLAAATCAVLTGAAQSADAWQRLGLIAIVAPEDTLASEVDTWFARIFAPRSAEALRHALTAVRGPLAEAVMHELPRVERLYLDDLMRTADAAEGIRAFMEKRPPRWRDC